MLGPAGASGHEYLEKMIQIPFRIPQPNRDQLIQFLAKQMGEPGPTIEKNSKESSDNLNKSTRSEGQSSSNTGGKEELNRTAEEDMIRGIDPTIRADDSLSPIQDSSKEEEPEEKRQPLDSFTSKELQIFQSSVDFLQPNPRYLKRLLNIYRLTRHLAKLNEDKVILNNPEILIKWLIICSRWPYRSQLMMQEFNKHDEAPKEENILLYLNKRLEKNGPNKFDSDPEILEKILAKTSIIGWNEFDALQKYTINLNPGVEKEILFEKPP